MATAKKAASAASKKTASDEESSTKTEAAAAADTPTEAAATGDAAKADEATTFSTSDTGGDAPKADDAGEARAQVAPAGSGDSGPQTGVDAPEDVRPRSAASTFVAPNGAAPIESPDVTGQTEPKVGHDESSTDHVYAVTGGQSIAGESVLRLTDEDGNELGADDLFDDSDPGKTFVEVKQTVIEVFRYPNTTVDCERVLYRAGRRLPRDLAERVRNAVAANV